MEKVPNWITLWRQLAEKTDNTFAPGEGSWSPDNDPWRKRARDFDTSTKHRIHEADPTQDLVTSQVDKETTVLDIGAGTGRWVRILSPLVRSVTALDPSPSMLSVLRESIVRDELANVKVIEGFWPATNAEKHDVSLCSHAIYTSPDFPEFINRMIEVTRRTCFLMLRVPPADGVMGKVFERIYGQPHDSANFIIAYNALLQMGINANALMSPHFRPWTNTSIDDAFGDLKRRLSLQETTAHDDYLRKTLEEKLVRKDGEYVWPDGMRSALAYWNV